MPSPGGICHQYRRQCRDEVVTEGCVDDTGRIGVHGDAVGSQFPRCRDKVSSTANARRGLHAYGLGQASHGELARAVSTPVCRACVGGQRGAKDVRVRGYRSSRRWTPRLSARREVKRGAKGSDYGPMMRPPRPCLIIWTAAAL